jgi:hypothetical protein
MKHSHRGRKDGPDGERPFRKDEMVGDNFEAAGISLLPYDDKMNWNPFQMATVKLKNASGRVLKKTQVVLQVSDEINCAKGWVCIEKYP